MNKKVNFKPFPGLIAAAALGLALAFPATSWSVTGAPGLLIGGLGGTAGFGTLALGRNDDSSSNALSLPFTTNFYGNQFNTFFVNNNGNITFNRPLAQYTPDPFPIASQPMIAPFWGDVDTRCASCGAVYVGSPNADTVVVTWDHVGYFSSNSDKTNTFQLVLRNRADTGAGNFDAEFRYAELTWTSGDFSGGSNGLGGVPAQAGLDAGDLVNFFTLPGSRTAGVLNLASSSNANPATAGLWAFSVRNGLPPGKTAQNPIMPVITQTGWNFNFNVSPTSGRVFIDPVVAIGYDYIVNSGPNVTSVLLPAGVGDGVYDLWLWDVVASMFVDSGVDILGGQVYNFAGAGVSRFSIRGIEITAGLDPTDTNAFVTGLTFNSLGSAAVDLTMVPLTVDTGGGGTVPVSGTLTLVGLGLAALLASRRKRAVT